MNSPRGDSRWHNILWWYHVNKYRATRGNRSELVPGRKLPRCHVNTPLFESSAVLTFAEKYNFCAAWVISRGLRESVTSLAPPSPACFFSFCFALAERNYAEKALHTGTLTTQAILLSKENFTHCQLHYTLCVRNQFGPRVQCNE